MKKSKLLILGLIGLLMVLGVIFIGCNHYDECDGKCKYVPDNPNATICHRPFDSFAYDECYHYCAAYDAYARDSSFSASCYCK